MIRLPFNSNIYSQAKANADDSAAPPQGSITVVAQHRENRSLFRSYADPQLPRMRSPAPAIPGGKFLSHYHSYCSPSVQEIMEEHCAQPQRKPDSSPNASVTQLSPPPPNSDKDSKTKQDTIEDSSIAPIPSAVNAVTHSTTSPMNDHSMFFRGFSFDGFETESTATAATAASAPQCAAPRGSALTQYNDSDSETIVDFPEEGSDFETSETASHVQPSPSNSEASNETDTDSELGINSAVGSVDNFDRESTATAGTSASVSQCAAPPNSEVSDRPEGSAAVSAPTPAPAFKVKTGKIQWGGHTYRITESLPASTTDDKWDEIVKLYANILEKNKNYAGAKHAKLVLDPNSQNMTLEILSEVSSEEPQRILIDDKETLQPLFTYLQKHSLIDFRRESEIMREEERKRIREEENTTAASAAAAAASSQNSPSPPLTRKIGISPPRAATADASL